MKIERGNIDIPWVDFVNRVNAFKAARAAHAFTVGQPAPTEVDSIMIAAEAATLERGGGWPEDALAQEPESEPGPDADRKLLKQQRDDALQSITSVVSGLRVQVRPQDAQNFQVAISLGQPQDWILADNTVGTLTIQDMQDALADGIAQAQAIWAAYTSAMRVLTGGA